MRTRIVKFLKSVTFLLDYLSSYIQHLRPRETLHGRVFSLTLSKIYFTNFHILENTLRRSISLIFVMFCIFHLLYDEIQDKTHVGAYFLGS